MRVQGTQPSVKPIEVNVDTVYVRTDIVRIETEDFVGWEYDEQQYSVRDYIEKISKEKDDLQQENLFLKAKTQANADRADFQEELIVEMAMFVYP